MRWLASGVLGVVAAGFAATARPADPPTAAVVPATGWFVHFGLGGVVLSESARMSVAGTPQPGATIRIDPQLTPVLEVGYFFTPRIAASFTGGIPPKIDIRGAGAAAGFGTLGTAVYGPSTLTVHYHFHEFGRFQPYFGAGIAYMAVLSSKDRVMTNLNIRDSVGPALQVGFDYMVDARWSVFLDVKKAFLRTAASGLLGGAPVNARVTVDPLVIQTGIGYRF